MGEALKLVFLIGLTGLFASNLSGQDKYWINKKDTARLHSLYGVEPQWCADWIPYCTITSRDVEAIRDTTTDLRPVLAFEPMQEEGASGKYGFALEQIGAHLLIENGWTARGVKIGIIDGGFLGADCQPSLTRHFEDGRVLYYRDYITPHMPPYTGSKQLDDSHGTDVWTRVGGHHHATQVISGIALDADYYLARTDHGAFEKRMEEDLVIRALEDLHQEGVALVNLSLGYADGYTRKAENYTPADMDGHTTMIAKAVDHAVREKNMLIVVSAGNEGARSRWRVLSTPADAEAALSVGASILSGMDRMKYSSIGTPGLGYIKPEVICFASNGTSFSAPIITGLAAAIMQMDTTLTALQVKDLIIRSCSLYPYGNNHLGYGIPQVSRLLRIMEGKPLTETILPIEAKGKKVKIPISPTNRRVTVLHKNTVNEVIDHSSLALTGNRLKIRQLKGSPQTTVLLDQRRYEIIWPE